MARALAVSAGTLRRALPWGALLWGALAGPAAAQSARSPEAAVLTFTGSASRGAYQAGLAHALLRTRAALGDGPILAAVGVSAGGVNATLTALTACRTDVAATPARESALWQVWAGLDWTAMFPHGLTCEAWRARFGGSAECVGGTPWGPDDGIATLNALRPVERGLLDLLARSDGWREGCRVPLGVGLSAAMPAPMPFKAAPLSSLRAHVLIEVRVIGGRARLCAPEGVAASDTGPDAASDAGPDASQSVRSESGLDRSAEAVVLPVGETVDGCRTVAPQDFWRVVRAGVAPPVYAGAQPVEICAADGRSVPAEGRTCGPGTKVVTARYLDGALLEALPVGLSLAAGRLVRPHAGFDVLALDATLPVPDEPVPDGVVGYAWYRRFFRTFLEVSRFYEAQTIARYQESSAAHGPVVRITHVRTPRRIYGDNLMGMGAFIHPALRRADFRRGELSAYRVMLPQLCFESPDRTACAVEVLQQTGAWTDDEFCAALLATAASTERENDPRPSARDDTRPSARDDAPELAGARARLLASGARADGRTPEGCETGTLVGVLAADTEPTGTTARDPFGAAGLARVLAAAEAGLSRCRERFEGRPATVDLPDGRPLSQFPGWLLGELRQMTERTRQVETAGVVLAEAERWLGYALDVQRVHLEQGVQPGSLPLATRRSVPMSLRVLEHAVYPVSFGGLVAPEGGLIVHWEYFAWSPGRPFTPLGLGTSLRWVYRPSTDENLLGYGPTVFSLWDPRRSLLLSTLGLRATLVPDFTEGQDWLRRGRTDVEFLWRLLAAHLEIAAGPSFALRPNERARTVDYRVIFSLSSLNLLLDHLLH